MTKSLLEQRGWNLLKEVMDPEFPISVVDMGLIYAIRELEPGELEVDLTYTSTACACMEWIEADIKAKLLTAQEISDVRINVVWDPPWTTERLSKEAISKLNNWGVCS